jgi:DNA-binding response OmpR family regulator
MPRDVSSKVTAPTTAAQDNPAVLVIDDDPALLRSLVALLKAHGISIVTACDGAQGLELFRRILPAVVLIDVIVPTQDGIDTIMQMRLERPEVKIIMMSGGGSIGRVEILAITNKIGADAALRKPFNASELISMICGMLDRLPRRAAKPHRLEAS